MPGIEQLPKTLNLAKRLQFYLDAKDCEYYILQALLTVQQINDLKAEESKLEAEFGFYSVKDACNNFRSLVLAKIKMEARILNIDMKPFYRNEADLYLSSCMLEYMPNSFIQSDFAEPVGAPFDDEVARRLNENVFTKTTTP